MLIIVNYVKFIYLKMFFSGTVECILFIGILFICCTLLGSDCTSSFYGKGKTTAWKTLISHPQFIETFSLLGSSFPPSDELVSALNTFTCLLYGDSSSTNVDECRYALFKAGKCSDDVLPPTRDSLLKHVERANYQSGVWYRCLTAQMVIPSPIGNGWMLSHEGIEIQWMTRPPAPDSLLECTTCKCKTGCQNMRCSCQKGGLKCTELCSCVGCQNGDVDEDEENSQNESDNDEVSDDGDLEDIDDL